MNCNANGIRTTYDVRWHVTALTGVTRSVVVGAKPNTVNNLSVKLYAPPVSLRTVAGQVP